MGKASVSGCDGPRVFVSLSVRGARVGKDCSVVHDAWCVDGRTHPQVRNVEMAGQSVSVGDRQMFDDEATRAGHSGVAARGDRHT